MLKYYLLGLRKRLRKSFNHFVDSLSTNLLTGKHFNKLYNDFSLDFCKVITDKSLYRIAIAHCLLHYFHQFKVSFKK